MRIVIALCTRHRPAMLRSCLDSLIRQDIPGGVFVSVVVIENDEVENCRGIVDEIAARSNVPIVYALEPSIGIPIARNRSLTLALAQDPDWIAFIDDDEVAGPAWLPSFVEAARMINADVLRGPVQGVHASSGEATSTRKRRPTGLRLKTAATNNTMMRAHLASPEGLGLCFDEAMRLSGGSDKDFFFRAADRGATIAWVENAVVFERIPPGRLTLRWQLERENSVGANSMSIAIRQRGLIYAVGRSAPKLLGRLAGACVGLPVGGLVYLVNRRRGSEVVTSALRKLWWTVGTSGAVFKIAPQRYRSVDGY